MHGREQLGLQRACDRTEEMQEALQKNDNIRWLADRQDLASPILPPTSSEASKLIYDWLKADGDPSKRAIDEFVARFNAKADGIKFFYLTPELLRILISKWQKLKKMAEAEEDVRPVLDDIDSSIAVHQEADYPMPEIESIDMTGPSGGMVEPGSLSSLPFNQFHLPFASASALPWSINRAYEMLQPSVLQPRIDLNALAPQHNSQTGPTRRIPSAAVARKAKTTTTTVDGKRVKRFADEADRKNKQRCCKICHQDFSKCKGATKGAAACQFPLLSTALLASSDAI